MRCLKPASGIVIACDDDCVQRRVFGVESGKHAIEHVLGFARWVLAVETHVLQ